MNKLVLFLELISYYLKSFINSNVYRCLLSSRKFKNTKTRKRPDLQKIKDEYNVEPVKLSTGDYAIMLSEGENHLSKEFNKRKDAFISSKERDKFSPRKRKDFSDEELSGILSYEEARSKTENK